MYKGIGILDKISNKKIHESNFQERDSGASVKNYIALMVISPDKEFTYFDFEKNTREKFGNKTIEAVLCLNSKNTRKEKKIRFSINNEKEMSYYFHNLSPNTAYSTTLNIPEFGMTLKSNVAVTPRNCPSKDISVTYLTI